MAPKRRPVDPAVAVYRLQGGTGKHVDGNIGAPLQGRPFQAFVQVTAASPGGSSSDGSLQVLPGFHAAAVHYFGLAGGAPPAGGFTPLTEDKQPELCDDKLWVPVTRMPEEWRAMHRQGELPAPSSAPGARKPEGVLKALRGLAAELRRAPAAPPQPGDYVLWDPRLPHSTGDKEVLSSLDAPRQVFYCAYTLAAETMEDSISQCQCRESGMHPAWAPAAQAHVEQLPDYEPFELSDLGKRLYGCSDSTNARSERRSERAGGKEGGSRRGAGSSSSRQAAGGAHAPPRRRPRDGSLDAEAGAGGEAASSAAHEAAVRRLLTPAHVSFYQRYGFVVVEQAVPESLTRALAEELRAHLLAKHEIDLDALKETLTLGRLSSAFSPDGSGMIELYWLHSMDAVRQSETLHEITLQLFAATWGAAAPGFKLQRGAGMAAPAPRPQLGLYIDRTSLRLPAAAIGHLVGGSRKSNFKIRIPRSAIPPECRHLYPGPSTGSGASGVKDVGEYAVRSLLAVRSAGGGRQYLVEWEGYPGQDSWEPSQHVHPSLITEFQAVHGTRAKPAAASVGAVLAVESGGRVRLQLVLRAAGKKRKLAGLAEKPRPNGLVPEASEQREATSTRPAAGPSHDDGGKQKVKRQLRCGTCTGCRAHDCGQCANCRD